MQVLNMKNAMCDLETLGTLPGCSILSIGVVMFDANGLGAEFYTAVSRASCAAAGLVEDANTLAWWSAQSADARKAIDAAEHPDAPTLQEALAKFNAFIKSHCPGAKVWGNGAEFDNAILNVALSKVGMRPSWAMQNSRCYRALKGIAPGPKLVRVGTYHNALDDAKSQALHAIELFKLHPTLVM